MPLHRNNGVEKKVFLPEEHSRAIYPFGYCNIKRIAIVADRLAQLRAGRKRSVHIQLKESD